ncbi:hypothetical protein K458DRAFT_385590 [Lentithecium fluviatile CBS 122367]|uniref:Uncharacterized protein n=1 Tax=Lentithecium fluviatile CBS 122367 TaxID=1168545 RepID=A0A6G1JBT1_9PLEO|nr:hypothetical protein K458DRAFT_385590 [Lentithecium fluviatile CBS 122367]
MRCSIPRARIAVHGGWSDFVPDVAAKSIRRRRLAAAASASSLLDCVTIQAPEGRADGCRVTSPGPLPVSMASGADAGGTFWRRPGRVRNACPVCPRTAAQPKRPSAGFWKPLQGDHGEQELGEMKRLSILTNASLGHDVSAAFKASNTISSRSTQEFGETPAPPPSPVDFSFPSTPAESRSPNGSESN